MTLTFGARLAAEFAAGRRLCAGIDPHSATLGIWGLEDSAAGAETLGRSLIEAAQGVVACVKPQIAFYERFGAAGYTALERVIADARQAGILVIADVKRGDIGSTFAAYADAWLAPGSPLESDAMTVHAYQGIGTLAGAQEYIDAHGKGLFVLSATSNPEARDVQQARIDSGSTLAQHIVEGCHARNSELGGQVGSLGVVLGATVNLDEFSIDRTTPRSGPILPVLAPGFGFQGADVHDVRELFGTLAEGVLVSESRSILNGGREELYSRIAASTEKIAEAYG